MDIGTVIGVAVVGYLLGSVSFARLVGNRLMPGEDLSKTNLHVPGGSTVEYTGVSATSVGARKGPKWGMLVGVLDMLKAFVPVLVLRLIWPDESYYLIAGVAVLVGHNYPIYYRFKGGRGQASLYGGFLAIDPIAVLVTTPVGMLVGLAIREMLFGYVGGQLLMILWFALFGDGAQVVYAIVVNLIFTIATIPEIKGYWAKRQAGEIKQIESWEEFKTSHPAMGNERYGDDDTAEAAP